MVRFLCPIFALPDCDVGTPDSLENKCFVSCIANIYTCIESGIFFGIVCELNTIVKGQAMQSEHKTDFL